MEVKEEKAKGGLGTEKVNNVMGSCAGAGSGEFHLYRRTRRTEMLRVEAMEEKAEKDRLDEEFQERAAAKRKECEDRTARNAEKRRRKKEKAKLKKIGFANDGSFLEKAKALTEASDEPPVKPGRGDEAVPGGGAAVVSVGED